MLPAPPPIGFSLAEDALDVVFAEVNYTFIKKSKPYKLHLKIVYFFNKSLVLQKQNIFYYHFGHVVLILRCGMLKSKTRVLVL
jgi:hypothetical protein